jgi:queuine/archaeosine tRNA-ribosyltransferase
MWAHLNNLLPYSLDGWRNAMNEIKPLRKVSTREYKEIKTKVNEYLENAFLFTHGDQQFNMKITAVKTGFCNPYESLRSHESETIYRKLDKIWGNLNTPDRESIRVNVFDMWSSLLKKHVVNHSYDIINRLEDMLIEVFLGVDVRDSVFYPLIQLMQQGIYVKEITTEGKVYIETTTTQKQ